MLGRETVRVEEPEAPDAREMLLGLREIAGPDGVDEEERVTVPEKPFRLVN